MGNIFKSDKKKHKDENATPPPAKPQQQQQTITDQDRAILQLKVQKDRLHKLSHQISLVIAREVQVAKELLKQDKKQNALLALKRKKYQEKLLDQNEKQQINLEQLVHSIQFASMQKEVFEALSHGNQVLNALNAQTMLEDVEQLMDDTREAVEYQAQVSKLLGTELNEVDNASIDETIAQWEAEEMEDQLEKDIQKLPDAPSTIADLTPADTDTEPVATTSSSSSTTKVKAKEVVLA